MIEENFVRASRWEAMDFLKAKLNGYRSLWKRVYIGVTASPRVLWAQHARDGWDKMVLLYEASTPEVGLALERDLLDYAQRCGFITPAESLDRGGEGITDEPRPSYLYVLVG